MDDPKWTPNGPQYQEDEPNGAMAAIRPTKWPPTKWPAMGTSAPRPRLGEGERTKPKQIETTGPTTEADRTEPD